MPAGDTKIDQGGQDVWENLWTARFSTLNNELAYQILDDAFPMGPGTPDTEETTPAETEYISFGKLFLNLVAYPLITNANSSADEAHVIMYSFNKYAAKLGYTGLAKEAGVKRNIASFALKKSAIKRALEKHLETNFTISPADVINIARKIMADKFNEQYGIIPTDDDGNYSPAIAAMRQSYQDLKKQISDDGRRKNALQATDSSADNYVLPADLADTRRALSDTIVENVAKLEIIEKEQLQVLKDGQEAAMAEMETGKIKMPALKMFVESVLTQTRPNGPEATTIVRLHVYDSNEKPYELHEIAANTATILGATRGAGQLYEDKKAVNLYDALDGIDGALLHLPATENFPAQTILNQRSLAIKKAIKANMPSITYGTEATAINSISINSISDSNINTHFLLETRNKEETDPSDNSGDSAASKAISSEAEKIFPVTMTIDLLGCPAVDFGQQIYIDMGTETDLDNVYAAINITLDIKPGIFKTTIKMSPTYSGESVSFGDLVNDVIATHRRSIDPGPWDEAGPGVSGPVV